ncbi:flagellar filament capping protein FliD [Siminovitchia sediminis]|uniref:Flagellar hook-associated protein 2 n=1 Tax=Siminovitchia sediminis TaxID=1274353 RepID=A0ABW4KMQ5_9BACI
MVRIGGLASGMDIDSIVKDMMKVRRMPLDKLKQQKQILEWKRDDYRSINTLLLGFRDQLTQLKLTSNYRARMVSSTDEARVSATAASGASQASYTISKVDQLAAAATRVGGELGEDVDLNQGLFYQKNELGNPGNWDTMWKKGVLETKTLSASGNTLNVAELNIQMGTSVNVKVNGQAYNVVSNPTPGVGEVYFDGSTLTFGDQLKEGSSVKIDYVVDQKTVTHTAGKDQKIISLGKGSVDISSLSVNGTQYVIDSGDVDQSGHPALKDSTGSEIGRVDLRNGNILFHEPLEENAGVSVTFTQNYTDFAIGAHTSKGTVTERIFVAGNESVNQVIRKVNESSAGITMFFDDHTRKLTMTRKETGDFKQGESDFILESGNSFLTEIMKIDGTEAKETEGQNAIFTINGLETQRTSNTFSMNGVTFTLKQTLKETDPPITVSVSNDSEGVFNTIKEFVDKYNTLIDEINKKLNEERHRDYLPLTDDEREELSDKQQEKWEELARSGHLKGDPILSGVLSQMRLDMSGSVETNSMYTMLAAIGITTTPNYMDGGKLEINENKLREAIEQDPEAVEQLFRGTGTTDANRGVIHKLSDSVNQSIAKIYDRAGRPTATNHQFALGRELLSMDKNIDSFEDRLKMYEDRLWRQFTAMEKAIQKANNQYAYLMQQFGGY